MLFGYANPKNAGAEPRGSTRNRPASAAASTPTSTPAPAACASDILSRNFQTAEKALGQALTEKDAATIKLGLKSPILSIRLKTAEAVQDLDDKSYVPSLIDALEETCCAMIDGGTETQMMQKDLNRTLVDALEKLTKTKFNLPEDLSPRDFEEVIKRSREWSRQFLGK